MNITGKQLTEMIDFSAVQANDDRKKVQVLAEYAKEYGFKYVTVLGYYLPFLQELLKDKKDIVIIGNVSFPSGGDSTAMKIAQAHEYVQNGCKEVDMVLNIGELLSGKYIEVENDIRAVVEATGSIPLKVIIEASYLNDDQIKRAADICVKAGANFVKTGTGWAGPTTVKHVKLIKSVVGDSIKIKAAGGIRDLETIEAMLDLGVSRFGINMYKALEMIQQLNK